jgi:pimeloyl-ACP methyl ester carboxylesterase
MGAYREQIVFTSSEDQRWLAGVLMCPTEGSVRPIGIVSLQGRFGYFYVPTSVYLGRALAERGYRYVSVNTRAREVASMDIPWPFSMESELQSRLGGEGFYRFDEEPHDVAGWINFLTAQGAEQIVLFGHSGGVRRALYYQAERQDPRVVGMILAGASDRSFTAIDAARLELAERMVAEGQGEALLPVPEGEPLVFGMESAESYARWGRYVRQFAADGDTPWPASIRVPVLATVGALEYHPRFRANLENMHARAVQAPHFDIQVIEGADHDYTGRERELAEVVLGWLETLPAVKGAARRHWWSR